MIRQAVFALTLSGICVACSAIRADEALDVQVMTFNIRCDTPRDGKDRWPHRREMVAELLRGFHGDFIGCQEALPNQMADLVKMQPDYGSLGRSRDATPATGEACPIFYRRDRWRPDPDQQGVFWLSETPEIPGSTSWNTACPRIVTWARFVEIGSGRGVYVFNTHLDHISEEAKRNGAALLAKKVAAKKNADPVIVMGDFNSGESSLVIQLLTGKTPGSPVTLVDTFRAVHPTERNVLTCHEYHGGDRGDKIDYILVPLTARVRAAEISHDNRNGRYVSDHYPVTADVTFPTESPKP